MVDMFGGTLTCDKAVAPSSKDADAAYPATLYVAGFIRYRSSAMTLGQSGDSTLRGWHHHCKPSPLSLAKVSSLIHDRFAGIGHVVSSKPP